MTGQIRDGMIDELFGDLLVNVVKKEGSVPAWFEREGFSDQVEEKLGRTALAFTVEAVKECQSRRVDPLDGVMAIVRSIAIGYFIAGYELHRKLSESSDEGS